MWWTVNVVNFFRIMSIVFMKKSSSLYRIKYLIHHRRLQLIHIKIKYLNFQLQFFKVVSKKKNLLLSLFQLNFFIYKTCIYLHVYITCPFLPINLFYNTVYLILVCIVYIQPPVYNDRGILLGVYSFFPPSFPACNDVAIPQCNLLPHSDWPSYSSGVRALTCQRHSL